MFEMFFLFIALFVLEIVLEIDNLTALRQAAAGLPRTKWGRGQVPHLLALGIRVGLAYFLFHLVSYFKHVSATTHSGMFEQMGGALLIVVAAGLAINYFHNGRNLHAASVRPPIRNKQTTLTNFLLADAFLSLDTVIAAVAMTSSFNLAMVAMVSAALTIMVFHKEMQAWLNRNPHAALIAFAIIGLLGFNLILSTQGVHIPKIALLFFVGFGVWLDRIDKDNKRRAAERLAKSRARTNGSPSQLRGSSSHLVQTIDSAEAEARALGSTATLRVSPRVTPASRAASAAAAEASGLTIPAIVDIGWNDVAERVAGLKAVVQAEQARVDGAYAQAPDGRKLAHAPVAGSVHYAGTNKVASAVEMADSDKYIFGTTHSAGIQPGLYGFIFHGIGANPCCGACGTEQMRTFSLCDRCGHYRFLCPAGIFEVGSLKMLTMRR